MKITTYSHDETLAFGKRLGQCFEPRDIVLLFGDLGAGKTTLTHGLCLGLGLAEDDYIRSPTFTLVNEYQGTATIYHIDLYRLDSLREIEALGLEDGLVDGLSVGEREGETLGPTVHCCAPSSCTRVTKSARLTKGPPEGVAPGAARSATARAAMATSTPVSPNAIASASAVFTSTCSRGSPRHVPAGLLAGDAGSYVNAALSELGVWRRTMTRVRGSRSRPLYASSATTIVTLGGAAPSPTTAATSAYSECDPATAACGGPGRSSTVGMCVGIAVGVVGLAVGGARFFDAKYRRLLVDEARAFCMFVRTMESAAACSSSSLLRMRPRAGPPIIMPLLPPICWPPPALPPPCCELCCPPPICCWDELC